MTEAELRDWIQQPHLELASAVAERVKSHVKELAASGIVPYGYALLPGEPYHIDSITVVFNSDSDLEVEPDDKDYAEYRYSVEEWKNWRSNEFELADRLLADANRQYQSHCKAADPTGKLDLADEHQFTHDRALLDAIVSGMSIAKSAGVFTHPDPFLVVWISDSSHRIMPASVKALCSPKIAAEFMGFFGE